RTLRRNKPSRPVILTLTCLHDAYPQQQHPQPYPFDLAWCLGRSDVPPPGVAADLLRSIEEQRRRFAGLFDATVPIDLTRPEEGYDEPSYGGERLREVLLHMLPSAYRQTLVSLDETTRTLRDLFARHAVPYILGYSSLAATAGAIPIPWVDLLILPGIQTRMIYHLARLYGQPLTGARFLELASTLGMGMVVRQASREVLKPLPYVGSVAGGALAATSTFALGKAFCYYYEAVHHGHVPKPEDLRRYYHEQLALAERHWAKFRGAARSEAPEKP